MCANVQYLQMENQSKLYVWAEDSSKLLSFFPKWSGTSLIVK